MTLALGEQMKTWVDEVVGKNQDLEEEVKTLTMKLENYEGQVDHLQVKIHDLEEEVKILTSVISGGEKEVSDVSKSRVLLEEENKSLRLEQLELTVKYQMRKMWEMINSELKDNLSPSEKHKQRQIEIDSDMVAQQLISMAISEQDVPTETNPLENEKILDKIFNSLPLSCLFKFRRVCKLWNNILVPKINQNGNNTRLLKIVDGECEEDPRARAKVIDIKEILVTIEAGRLKYSTCTKIYFNRSMKFNPSAFDAFLALNGKNIKVLHYDGYEISDLRKILKICAHNLECLSMWRDGQRWGLKSGLNENNEEPKLIFPNLETIIFVSGEDGNRDMRRGLKMKNISFIPAKGMSSPSEDFLIDIFEASPKLHSLSCRLYLSRFLEGLALTNSYLKLTSLCLKSRVSVQQLRLLISAKMQLKILHLEGFCVTVHTYAHDYHPYGREFIPDPDDPELMEFAPLLLEFLQSQASTLEYLKLDLFTERSRPHPNIPTHVLLNHFPRMPNLITFVVGSVDASRTDFPFEMSTFGELFPKLRNLENIPLEELKGYEDSDKNVIEVDEDIDFPGNYPVSPNASFSLQNIRGLDISPDLAQFFPFITELHLADLAGASDIMNSRTIIGMIHKIPSCLPRLKHFYNTLNFEHYCEDEVLKLIRILNGFMTGISPAEQGRITQEQEEHCGFHHLDHVQFPRSRPSIFNLNDLETLYFKFSCEEFTSACESPGIFSAIAVLISWGLSRMTHLKKLHFQFEQRVQSLNVLLPDSCGTLLNAFRNRENLETRLQGFRDCALWVPKICDEKNWNFELNLKHHTSEWDQLNFLDEDPDIWNLNWQ